SEVLKDVMSDENLRGKPILVLVNKKDRSGCIDEIQLSDRFCLHDLANLYTAQIRVEVCSANQGTGNAMDGAIKDGFEWLLERIFDDFDRLEKGVNEALKMLKQKQEEERIRRQHRLAAALNSASNSGSKAGSERNSNASVGNEPNTAFAQPQRDDGATHLVQKMERRNGHFHKWSRNQVAPLPQTSDDHVESSAENTNNATCSRAPRHLPPLQLSNTDEAVSKNSSFSRRVSSAGPNKKALLGSRVRSPVQIVPLTSFPPSSSIVVKPRRHSLSHNDSV
uniref:ADP-ribosylation factor-like protein 13B n=1 Tax=Parascaris univalens TaxID=6257 RepID=A0A915AC73_PARUN